MKRAIVTMGLVAVVAASAVWAEEDSSAGLFGVTAKVGTLGFGGDLTLRMGRYLSLRGGYNQLDLEGDITLDETDVRGDLNWQSIPLLLDVHPFANGFRVSGGVVRNNNELLLSADSGDILTIGGIDFEVDDLDGIVEFDKTSYYAGIGYGAAAGKDGRWHFSCDFGVMFQGEPQVDATAVAADPRYQDVLDVALEEELDKYRDDIKNFQYYPVVSIGVSLRI
jgi:hypothetical protein